MGRPRIQHQFFDGVESKRCSCCRNWRSLDQFGASKSTWDGLRHRCKPCAHRDDDARYEADPERERQRVRDYTEANRAAVQARSRVKYASNPEHGRTKKKRWYDANAEYARQYAREYGELNREAIAAKAMSRRRADPEAAREMYRRHHQSNAEKRRRDASAAGRERRARKRELPCEKYTEQQIVDRDGFWCWICAEDIGTEPLWDGRRNWVVEHLIPLSADYPDHPGDSLVNVSLACASCNQWKYNRVLPAALARYEANCGLDNAGQIAS